MVEFPCWVSGERADDRIHGVVEAGGVGVGDEGDKRNGSAMGNTPMANCPFISLI